MAKIRRMQGYSPKASQIKGLRNKPIGPEDYIYALEVAGQPAATDKERAIKAQAEQDVKYLEAKYPGIAGKFKLFEDRVKNTEPMKSINQKKSKLGKAN
jgi:hypothetical protein